VANVTEFLTYLEDHDTATDAVTAWCRRHLPGSGDALSVAVLHDREAAVEDYDGALSLAPGETLHCRRVLLKWGSLVISEAENWYVPQRLPAAMLEEIRRGRRPFGAVVAALAPRRTLIAVHTGEVLLHGGEAVARIRAQLIGARVFSAPAAFALHVTAVMAASGIALAELREHYRRELLAE
jgi:chorismate-pyruvate lyase